MRAAADPAAGDRWVPLEGTVNTRDVGGLPATGGRVRANLLLRSDNLQALTASDVAELVEVRGVRTVLDLRTDTERASEGQTPLARCADVVHLTLPFIPDDATVRADPGAVLPNRWADGAVGAYVHYLQDRPESFAAAVTRLADPAAGGAVVHCAAGKDRTGALVAVVLDVLGVPREVIAADYEQTNQRIEAIYGRLAGSRTYAADVRRIGLDAHRVEAATMLTVLDRLDADYGGTVGYLLRAGIREDALAALRQRFIEPS